MIRRLREPRTESSEFNRALELRPTWWIRTSRPSTYYMSFSHAFLGWWQEQWPIKVVWVIAERFGRWQVRDSGDRVWGPYLLRWTAERQREGFDRCDPGRAIVERVAPPTSRPPGLPPRRSADSGISATPPQWR